MADLNIGINVVAGPAKKALNDTAKATSNLSKSIVRAQASTKNMGKQFNSTAVATNKFAKGAMQQAGYQIADFAVQVQNGTSAVQAFGQQGSQMLAVFGPAGAILGAVVAVGSALTTVFLGLRGEAKKTKGAVEELNQAIGSLGSTYDTSVASSLTAAEKKFGDIGGSVRVLLDDIRELSRTREFEKFAAQAKVVADSFEDSSESIKGLLNAFGPNFEQLSEQGKKAATEIRKNLSKQLNLSEDQSTKAALALTKYQKAISSLKSKDITMEGAKEAAASINEARKTLVGLGLITDETSKRITELAKNALEFGSTLQQAAGKDAQKSVSELANQINDLAKQEVKAATAAAKARKKEGDERARQAVALARAEVQAAQAVILARAREAAKRQAIFDAELRAIKATERAYSASLAPIKRQTEALRIQNEMFGQSNEAIKAQIDFLRITNDLKDRGKNLTLEELDVILALIKTRKDLQDALNLKREEQKKELERARQALKLDQDEVSAAIALNKAKQAAAAIQARIDQAKNDAIRREQEAELAKIKSIEEAYSASLASINKQTEALRLQNQLFGQSEEAIKAQVDFLAVTDALKEKGKSLTLEELDAIHAQLEARAEEVRKLKAKTEEQRLQAERERATDAALKKINAEREKAQKRINQLIGDGFRTASDAIAGLISGTNTWRDALTQVLRKVIDIASQMGTTKSGGFSFDKLFGAVGGLFGGGGFSPVPQAGPIGAGGLQTFHTGGVVGRDSGPIGPRSDERLIMARTGERVLNRGETMGSVAGGGVVVNQTINLSTGVQQTVRAEVMSLAPQIAAQAKAAVLDAKKRGGGFGAAFA
jgi:DNA repair exonuclease SbcCD ATPase subunit